MKSFYGILFLSFFLCSCGITDRRSNIYYNTSDDAVVAAFDRFLRRSVNQSREYGGIIYRDNEGYFYTFTRGLSDSGALSFYPQKFNASSIAMWHTHWNSEGDFTEQDKITADRLCIDSYMMNKTDVLFLYKGCNL